MAGPTIVTATEEHVESVARIEKSAHVTPWRLESFRRELTNPDGIFLVAQQGGTVVGYALAWIIVDEAHIVNVAVEAEHRGRGTGRILVEQLLEESRRRGARCATLEVRVGNEAAVGLYRKLGFVEAGLRKRYYHGVADALIMWLHEMPA
ncbi:MAG: ribosomal protein S18-alanine N-acetyltransferase [Fimbriimonadaceae bacterium]